MEKLGKNCKSSSQNWWKLFCFLLIFWKEKEEHSNAAWEGWNQTHNLFTCEATLQTVAPLMKAKISACYSSKLHDLSSFCCTIIPPGQVVLSKGWVFLTGVYLVFRHCSMFVLHCNDTNAVGILAKYPKMSLWEEARQADWNQSEFVSFGTVFLSDLSVAMKEGESASWIGSWLKWGV